VQFLHDGRDRGLQAVMTQALTLDFHELGDAGLLPQPLHQPREACKLDRGEAIAEASGFSDADAVELVCRRGGNVEIESGGALE